MQASMGITRLLALSLLLHSVGSQTTTMTPTDDNTNKTEPVTVSVTADPSGAADNLTKPTGSTPTNETTVNPTSAPVTVKATDDPATTQPQSTAPATSPASPSATTVVGNKDTVETTDPPTTPAAASSSVVSTPAVTPPPNLPVAQTATTPQPLSSDAPSETTASDVLSVSSGTTVSGNQAPTLSPSKAGQVGKEKTTEASKEPEQTTLTTSNTGGAAGPQGGLTSSTPSSTPLTKTSPQTAGTSSTKAGGPAPTDTTTTTTTTAAATVKTFSYSFQDHKNGDEEDLVEKKLVEVCKRLMFNFNLDEGNCTLTLKHHDGAIELDSARINGKVKTDVAKEIYQDVNKKPTDNKTLIAILASCGALLIMIVILAVCASHHRKPFSENQQHLTEELHTVENGYHDNPTLEVMEVQPEMQEKKMALNGEFNDSWIVPIDNLLKEDMPDEEDTHL